MHCCLAMQFRICQRQVFHHLLIRFLTCNCNLTPYLQVNNHQPNEVMEYGSSPKTEFQRYIRLSRKGNKTTPNSYHLCALNMMGGFIFVINDFFPYISPCTPSLIHFFPKCSRNAG